MYKFLFKVHTTFTPLGLLYGIAGGVEQGNEPLGANAGKLEPMAFWANTRNV